MILMGIGFFYSRHSYLLSLQLLTKQQKSISYEDLVRIIDSIPDRGQPVPAGAEGTNILRLLNNRITIGASVRIDASKESFEDRTARIIMRFDPPVDLRHSSLVDTVQSDKKLVGKGYLGSRVQFELSDDTGKTLHGPKMHVMPNGKTVLFLRPSTTEPVPTGAFQTGFDLQKVSKISVTLTVGKYPEGSPDKIVDGSFRIGRVAFLPNELISGAAAAADVRRVTRDVPNIAYEMRKLLWSREQNEFFVGINYPWNHYGWDVGKNPYGQPENSGWSNPENRQKLLDDFGRLKSIGIKVVRIYVFFDLRTGSKTDETSREFTGFDGFVENDIRTMFEIAHEADIKIMPVLFDFGIASLPIGDQSAGHPELLFTARKQKLFSALIPILKKMADWDIKYEHPVYALELMNEPENMAMLVLPGYFEGLKNWLKDLAVIIHQETSFKVTLGSHSMMDMQRWWSDLPIDIWQFHFYEYMKAEHDFTPFTLDRKDIRLPGLIICGELDPRSHDALDAVKDHHYSGAMFWSFNANDGITVNVDEIRDWIEQHQNK